MNEEQRTQGTDHFVNLLFLPLDIIIYWLELITRSKKK